MSINSSGIGSITIDDFSGSARAITFARLIDEKNRAPVPPTNPGFGSSGGGFGSLPGNAPPRHNPFPFDNGPPRPYEQPTITVSVRDMLGNKGQETLDVTSRLDFVTVRNLDIQDADAISASSIMVRNMVIGDPEDDLDISVNIRDLEIE